VQAILKTFPGAKLDTVRRKGEQASLLAGLQGQPAEEPPLPEEYPADDDIPESEF
jgi:DNA polymerase-3 subunit gamma/tau